MNPQLPPLPELPRADGDFSEDNGALSFTYTQAKMEAYATAYGLQCAEAERARCLLEVTGLMDKLRPSGEEDSHHNFARSLLHSVARRIERK